MTRTAIDSIQTGKKKRQSNELSSIAVNIRGELVRYLEDKNIDMEALSIDERYEILTKFLESNYTLDTDLLPADLKRDAIAKEQYFLDEILQDQTLSAYTIKTQWSVPLTQAIAITTINKILALSWLPALFTQAIKDMLAQPKDAAIFTSLDAFRAQLQKIIDEYDVTQNPDADQVLSKQQLQQIANISIDNNDILDALQQEGSIDQATYTTLKTQKYDQRPDDYKKAFATQLRKQFSYSYMDQLNIIHDTSKSIAALIKMPEDIDDINQTNLDHTIMDEQYANQMIDKYASKLWLDGEKYKKFVRDFFDPKQKELTIPWPEGNIIHLNFLDKQKQPFKFVLDGSDEEEIQKISSTMPYKKWHTINGQKFDPQQQLIIQTNTKTIQWYAYKIMHDGEEHYVFTEQWQKPGAHTDAMQILTKEGVFEPLSQTTQEQTIIMHSEKNPKNDEYKLNKKEPSVFSMDPVDVSWLLAAYCLNNSTHLSEQDKKGLFVQEPKPQKLSNIFADQILWNDQENKKETTASEQKQEENKDDYQKRIVQERQSAFKAWNDILWHKEAKFQKWWLIAIQNVESIFTDIPGNGWYTLLELTRCDDREQPTTFKYKVVGGTETDIVDGDGKSLEWEESNELSFSQEWFSKLKDFGNGTIYKFSPAWSVENILEYIKNTSFANQGMDLFKNRMDMISYHNGKLKNNTDEEIKYFWTDVIRYDEKGKDRTSYVMFETTFHTDTVSIKDKNGWYKKEMSWAAFAIFMADKGLRPYSQKQYDEDIEPVEINNVKSKKAFFVVSPMNIINGVKKWWQGTFVDWTKKSNDRRVEKIEEMFYTSGMTSRLANIPVYGEYFTQAQDEFNTKISEKHYNIVMNGDATINQRWKKLVRGKDTYLKNHNLKWEYQTKALKKVESFFIKAQKWQALDDVERREAMAWLLYVLDKYNTPYPRILAKYAGQHLRPRLLLNSQKYEKYMQWFNETKHKLEQWQARGDDVRELMNAVMNYDTANMSELMKDSYHRYVYGYKTIPELQTHAQKRKDETARKDGANAATSHPSFAMAYRQEVKDRMEKGEYAYVVWALVELSKRKELSNPANYRRWLVWVVQIILSWGIRYAANISDRKYLRDFLRKHGLPLWDYILDNAQGWKDLAALLELISKNAWCTSGFISWTKWNTKLDSYQDRWKVHKDFVGSSDSWFLWEWNIAKILPFLENSNMGEQVSLATIAKDPKTSSSQRELIERYLTVSINAHPARDYGSYDGAENFVTNVIQDRTIFNTSRQLLQEQYMNYNQDGNFWKREEEVWYFWDALRKQFAWYTAKDTIPPAWLEQIIIKYYTLFQQSYGWDHEWFLTMLAYMKNAKTPQERKRYAQAAISAYIKKNKSYSVFPAMMSAAFAEVERFFVKHIENIDDTMITSLINYPELDWTDNQKEKALKSYHRMKDNPQQKRKKQDEKVQKYITDLFSGKARWASSDFKWFDVSDGIDSSNIDYDDEDIAAISDYNQWVAQEQQEKEQQEKQRQEQEEKEKEERERKEREEQEKKEREQQELDAEK